MPDPLKRTYIVYEYPPIYVHYILEHTTSVRGANLSCLFASGRSRFRSVRERFGWTAVSQPATAPPVGSVTNSSLPLLLYNYCCYVMIRSGVCWVLPGSKKKKNRNYKKKKTKKQYPTKNHRKRRSEWHIRCISCSIHYQHCQSDVYHDWKSKAYTTQNR